MELLRNMYTVYVKINDDSYITAVSSSVFLKDTAGWTEIDRGYGERYAYARYDYFPKPIYTKNGAYRYKLVDGKPVECTPEEIAAQEEATKPAPTPSDNLAERVSAVESDVAALTVAIEKGLSL